MGHIKIDELSNSLKDYINTLGLTEEQVNNLIKQFSGDKTKLQTNAKGSLVDAINELFQSANNGKELIANAIGEPLVSTDTFSAMSTGINGLLSTFKTNMMNNGVVVESSDKFKQLIDKIATLADSEGKGIKFAEGTYRDFTEYLTTSGTSVEVSYDLNFTPTLIFVMFDSISNTAGTTINNVIISNKAVGQFYMNYTLSTMISNMTSNGFSMVFTYGDNSNITFNGVTWYAIGVGEEDTTLRDSLASILQDEGVIIVPEDNMASLITKTDNEFEEKRLSLLEALTVKNIPINNNDSFDTLIGYISLFENYNLPTPNELNIYDSIGVIENASGITFEKNTDHMLITIPQSSTDYSLLIGTNTKYDLTDYANIVVEYYSSTGRFALGINDISQDFTSCDYVKYHIGESNYNKLNTYKLNISDYNSEYYILFNVDAASVYGGSIKFYKIYLEK